MGNNKYKNEIFDYFRVKEILDKCGIEYNEKLGRYNRYSVGGLANRFDKNGNYNTIEDMTKFVKLVKLIYPFISNEESFSSRVPISAVVDLLNTTSIDNMYAMYNSFKLMMENYSNRPIGVSEDGKTVLDTSGFAKFTCQLCKDVAEDSYFIVNPYTQLSSLYISDRNVNNIEKIAKVYNVLSENLPAPYYDKNSQKVCRPADKIVTKIATSENMFNCIDYANVKDIIETLINPNYREVPFSKEELMELLVKTTSILALGSKKDIDNSDAFLSQLGDYIIEKTKDEKLKNLVSKNINLRSISLKAGKWIGGASSSTSSLFDLLTGVSLGEVLTNEQNYLKRLGDIEKIKNVSLQINENQLYHLLTQCTYILNNLSPVVLVNIAKDFNILIDKLFDGAEENRRFKKSDFDINRFLTGNNVIHLLLLNKANTPKNEESRSEQFERYKRNITILNNIMPTSSIFEIMRNNFTILNLDPDFLKSEIGSLIEECGGDIQRLKVLVNEFLNIRMPLHVESDRTIEMIKNKSRQNILSCDNLINSNIEDIDDTFSYYEIELDIKDKIPTLTEMLKEMSFDDCLKLAKEYAKNITDIVNSVDKDSNIDLVMKDIKIVEKIISKMKQIIKEVEISDFPDAIMKEVELNHFIKYDLSVAKKAGSLVSENISTVNGKDKFSRGRNAHIDPSKIEGTTAYAIKQMLEAANKVKDNDIRNVLLNRIEIIKEEMKDLVVKENIKHNEARKESYNNALTTLPAYGVAKVAEENISSLEEKYLIC